MKSFILILLFVSTIANGLEVRSRYLSWHPPKSDEIPTDSSSCDPSGWTQRWWENVSIKMPFVTGKSIKISSRINNALYMEQMGIDAPVKSGKSFSLPTGMCPVGIMSLDFKVNRNDATVLEIEFEAEGCGAYCENYTTVAHFDVRSGWRISLVDN
jgi:hypothetical protein